MRTVELSKSVAYAYKNNVRELEKMNCSMAPRSAEVSCFVKGRVTRPTEAEAMRNITNERYNYIRQSVEAVEYALDILRTMPNGETTIKLFRLVYHDATHKVYGAALELHISEPTAWRYNAYLLRLIGYKMGYIS